MKYSLMTRNLSKTKVIRINNTGELVEEFDPRFPELLKKYRANLNRAQKDDAMKSLGLVKTKYGWE
jgi:hypothetical protein